MKISKLRLPALALTVALAAGLGQAEAASCGNNPAQFGAWLTDFKAEAVSAGISRRVVDQALSGVTYDPRVIKLDRNQRHFSQPFEVYAKRVVSPGRVAKGKRLMQQYKSTLDRIEKQFGVPAPILIAIWGMETDFGAGSGNLSTIRSLATLAFDCRRSEFFQEQLMAALKIVQRGDLRLNDMIGAYAGEIGQTQFLPSSYIKYGVDYDGNGHVDLRHSVPDVLASTANLLRANGWQAGQPFGEGTRNFEVMREWNRSEIYRKTMVLFAQKLM